MARNFSHATKPLNTLKVARDHELQFKSIQHHFWLRLQLWSDIEKVSIAFPWYDTKREIDRFLNSVRSDDAGEVYFDGDQGWELEVYANDGRLFFRESDPDANEVRFELSCDRDKLAEDIQILQERTSQIIAELTRRLGADVWTEVVDRPDFYLYRGDQI